MTRRRSGLLLPVASLMEGYGIGDMGPGARLFVDFLQETGQGLWQILPLTPTDPCYGNSPYHSITSFGSNPLLISPELLIRDGLLYEHEVPGKEIFHEGVVDYKRAAEIKNELFNLAYRRFIGEWDRDEYHAFCEEQSFWLEDFALFLALKDRFQGRPWHEWPTELRDRHPDSLKAARSELKDQLGLTCFLQFLFLRQWEELRRYCKERGVLLVGDMPIYVVQDSADVWVSPHYFKLNAEKQPQVVAGVPPDYFSETGQLWGNPVYDWDALRDHGYDWWLRRIRHNLSLYDLVRLDHFRGFVAYWEIPAGETTAINGHWVEAPARDFFNRVVREFPKEAIIAEDLGFITEDVREVMKEFMFPGMKVLLFAFGSELAKNPYAPHNHVRNCVVYTGTHDNNTARGWFEEETSTEDRARLEAYVGHEVTADTVHWDLIHLALGSVADTAILSMVDVLGLGAEDRINRPAKTNGNWKWRLPPGALTDDLAERLVQMVEIFGRYERP